jgi:flagellar basal body-associated protein FliL
MEEKKQENKKVAENSEKKEKKGSGLIIILILLIVLLLAALGGAGYLYNTSKDQEAQIANKDQRIKSKTDTISFQIAEIKRYQDELQAKSDSLISLGQSNAELETKIQQIQRRLIVAQRNVGDLKALKDDIEKYKKLLAQKDAQIDSLKAAEAGLKTQITGLEKDRQILGDTVTNLRTSKQELAERLALAAVLRAENIKVTALDKKGKEQVKEGFKAKKVDKLKVVFNLADNKVAEKNTKQIMLRVIDPSGAVLFDNNTGGGTFTAAGKEIPYTAMQDISFSNTKQKLTYNYVKGSAYVPGTYKIELYAEGHMIGEGQFLVKK